MNEHFNTQCKSASQKSNSFSRNWYTNQIEWIKTSIYFTLNSHFLVWKKKKKNVCVFKWNSNFYCSIHKYNTKFVVVKVQLTHVRIGHFFAFFYLECFIRFWYIVQNTKKNSLQHKKNKKFEFVMTQFKSRSQSLLSFI